MPSGGIGSALSPGVIEEIAMMSQIAPIRIVTISRGCGAGGRYVGDRIARALGWKLWDKELAHELAKVSERV
jgi:hypothetical protein